MKDGRGVAGVVPGTVKRRHRVNLSNVAADAPS